MSNRDWNMGSWAVLAVLATAGLVLGVLIGKSRNRIAPAPVAMTETARPETGTNPTPRLVRSVGLKAIEEQLSQSFKGLSPKSPSEATRNQRLSAPIARAPNRAKKASEERNNTMYLELEDLGHNQDYEERLDALRFDSDGRAKTKQTPKERYMERLQARDEGKSGSSGSENSRADGSQSSSYEADSRTPESILRTEQALRKVLGPDRGFTTAFNPAPAERGALADFGFEIAQPRLPTTRAEDRHTTLMNQYRELLNGPALPAGADLSKPFNTPAPTVPGMTSGLDPFGQGSRRQADSSFDFSRPLKTPSAPEDPTREVLNRWSPTYTEPVEDYKRVAPPKPNFDAPRRRF